MRQLNDWIVKHSYPLPRQQDIMARMIHCKFFTVCDQLFSFYQFLVHPDDRHIYSINTHRGQEILNVAGMGCKNSVQHIQRQGDLILKDMSFACVYVDDFVVYSTTFEAHVEHLKLFFRRLDEYNFSIPPKKTFVGYQTVKLLGQRVDAFGYASTTERMEALRHLKFPATAADLETYCGMIQYLADQTPYLSILCAPLNRLKAEMLRLAPQKKGAPRKRYARTTRLPDDPAIRAAFDDVQSLWDNPVFCFHQDPSRPLFCDVDTSGRGIGVVWYHVTGDPEPTMEDSDIPDGYEDDASNPTSWLKRVKNLPKASIEPIMFASKVLSPPETRYMPTELEMAGVAWAVRKAKHLVDGAPKTYIFTDHSAVTAIARQRTISNTESLNNLNLRLQRASMYLQQFDLDVRYRPGRLHLVPDALSRLEPLEKPKTDPSAI